MDIDKTIMVDKNDYRTHYLSNDSFYPFKIDNLLWSTVNHYVLTNLYAKKDTIFYEDLRTSSTIKQLLSKLRYNIIRKENLIDTIHLGNIESLPIGGESVGDQHMLELTRKAMTAKFSQHSDIMVMLNKTWGIKIIDAKNDYANIIYDDIRGMHRKKLRIKEVDKDLTDKDLSTNHYTITAVIGLAKKVADTEGIRDVYSEMVNDAIKLLAGKKISKDISNWVDSLTWNDIYTKYPNMEKAIQTLRRKGFIKSGNKILKPYILIIAFYKYCIQNPNVYFTIKDERAFQLKSQQFKDRCLAWKDFQIHISTEIRPYRDTAIKKFTKEVEKSKETNNSTQTPLVKPFVSSEEALTTESSEEYVSWIYSRAKLLNELSVITNNMNLVIDILDLPRQHTDLGEMIEPFKTLIEKYSILKPHISLFEKNEKPFDIQNKWIVAANEISATNILDAKNIVKSFDIDPEKFFQDRTPDEISLMVNAIMKDRDPIVDSNEISTTQPELPIQSQVTGEVIEFKEPLNKSPCDDILFVIDPNHLEPPNKTPNEKITYKFINLYPEIKKIYETKKCREIGMIYPVTSNDKKIWVIVATNIDTIMTAIKMNKIVSSKKFIAIINASIPGDENSIKNFSKFCSTFFSLVYMCSGKIK